MLRIEVALALSDEGYDVLRASEVGQERADDFQILQTAINEVASVSEKYFINQKPVRSSDGSYDREAARQLWGISLELTGLS